MLPPWHPRYGVRVGEVVGDGEISDMQPNKEPIRYNKTHRIMGKMVYTRETTSFLSHLPFRASAATTLALYVVQQNLFFLQETLNFL
jgi:hypothetical protein